MSKTDASRIEHTRRAVLAFDAAALEATASDGSEGLGLFRAAWSGIFRGDYARAAEHASALEGLASSRRDAAMVIEGAALRALAEMQAGDMARAIPTARRASRMARTEAIPEQEYFAHLVLSRVRRLSGHPHLATRILTALAAAAPGPWQPWLRWELLMAGAHDPLPPPMAETPASAASATLAAVLSACDAGDRAAFGRATSDLERAATCTLVSADARAVLDGCDLDRTADDPDVLGWCAGATADGPPHLHGLLTRAGSAPSDESAIAYVLAHPDGVRRRVPRLAWAFARDSNVTALAQGRRKQGRVETLVSALALAGDGGIEEAECFADIYEFAYEPEVHKNIFHVLVHRAREWLGGLGTVEVGGGRVILHLERPILVPDPRCTKPMQDRLLRAVAEHRGATAKDIAQAIGVSLRVAQSALQELSADGACLAQRDGKQVRYVIEDTTFSEPTVIE